jgi:uncharacterized paraquat-inducible protein A
MISISYNEFSRLVAMRRQVEKEEDGHELKQERENVLRPDQLIQRLPARQKSLATCPDCDAVVDADILHPQSGLCPVCHEERLLRRW